MPLYGFVRGDTLGVVVLAQDRHTVAQVTAQLLEAVAPRVAPPRAAALYARGRRLDPRSTVAQAGLEALDRVDLVGLEDDHG